MSHGAELVGIYREKILHGKIHEKEKALLDAEEACYSDGSISTTAVHQLTNLFMEVTGEHFPINH